MNRSRALSIVKLVVGGLLVFWLVRSGRLNLDAYKGLWSGKNAGYLILMVGMQAGSLTIVLGRWWFLLRGHKIPLTIWGCILLGYRGMFATLFMPGSLGLDGTRAIYIRNRHRDQLAEGIASMIVDRFVGLVGLLMLASIFSLYLAVSHGGSVAWTLAGTIVTAMLSVVGSLAVVSRGWLPRVAFFNRPIFRKWALAFQTYREDTGALVSATLLSMVAHLLTSLAACAGLAVLGQSFSWITVAAITPVVIFARFVPVTPMGLGVSDSVAEALYDMSGISGGAEVQMLLRATMVLLLVSGGISFWSSVESQREPVSL